MTEPNQPTQPTDENVTDSVVSSDNSASEAPAPADTSAPAEASTTSQPAAPAAAPSSTSASASGGPISLDRIRQLRKSQQKTTSKIKVAAIPSAKQGQGAVAKSVDPKTPVEEAASEPAVEVGVIKTPSGVAPKVAVPSRRESLSQDMEDEISFALGGGDLDALMVGDESLQVGHELSEGQRIQGSIVKVQDEFVFVSLGGPNEGMIATTQFEETPAIGTQIEVVVRGYVAQEGLYELTVPGAAIEVSDWDDLNEGEVIEVLVTGSNSGGLECKAGNVRGFIPASQVAEYRVENLADMVDQKVLCVITEANARRGNLVLSRRAVLEREKREKRDERLKNLSVGDSVDGTVTKIMDFGAFVDIGGLDGLLHISQLSWDRVQHPSEVVEQGQQVKVRIEKIDEQTGKIGLSYRSLQEHPWHDIEAKFPAGSIAKGTVTRIAEFGAFVKVSTGVEGLVHVSELAHHRVHSVANVVSEGQEVDVKVLSVEPDKQRMSLSIKGAQAAPEPAKSEAEEAKPEEPPAKPVLPKHRGPLKGGTGGNSGGEQFGLKW